MADNIAGSVQTTARLNLASASRVDSSPIVNPEAFRYLEKPVPEKSRQNVDDIPASAVKPPKFVVPLANLKLNEGTVAQLTCKLEGYPFPTVSWFKDGRPLPASNRLITNYNLNSGIVSLKINDVLVGDQGNYTVLAQNRAGQDQTNCVVRINVQPNVDETSMIKPDALKYLETPKDTRGKPDNERENFMPPRFIIPLTNVQINERQLVQLACKVEGYPKPKVNNTLFTLSLSVSHLFLRLRFIKKNFLLLKITWLKDNRPLPASTRFNPDYDLYTGIVTLKINEAQVNDIGNYSVIAENEVGMDRTNCAVSIRETPNIDNTPMINPDAFRYLESPNVDRKPASDDDTIKYPPKVIVPLTDVKLEEGQSVLLACKIEGLPIPKVAQ